MVELACQEHASFEASPIEVEAGEKSYSVVTLKRISRLHPQARLFFILGVDAFLEIETWRNYEEILRGCQWIVMSRPRFSLESAGAVLAGKLKDKIRRVEKSDKINDDVLERFGIFLIEIEALDISSTDIRRRILRGESLEGLLPAAVEAYIQEKGLYHDRS
jgi:nicotinate-nucleotide adenylyltransferase